MRRIVECLTGGVYSDQRALSWTSDLTPSPFCWQLYGGSVRMEPLHDHRVVSSPGVDPQPVLHPLGTVW
jgi:hypothetical protein